MREAIHQWHVRPAEPADIDAVAGMAQELAVHVHDPDPGDDLADLIRDGFGRAPRGEKLARPRKPQGDSCDKPSP